MKLKSMKKKSLLFVLPFVSLLFEVNESFAQQGVVTTGGYVTNSNGSMSFSVGHIDGKPVSNDSVSMSPGTQIPIEVLTSITNPDYTEFNFSIYPNPTSGILNIDIKSNSKPNYILKVIDLSGKLSLEKEISNTNSEVSLESLTKGNYTLILLDKSSLNTINTTKIIKF